METSAVKALTFDVLGTVVAHRETLLREGRALGRAKGIEVDWARLVDRWRAHQGAYLDRERRGEVPWAKSEVLYRRSLAHVLGEMGVRGLDETEIDAYGRTWERLDPWPDSVKGLTRLKNRYIVAAMSNANIAMIVKGAKFAGLPWDAVLGSEIAGHYKPHPDVYLKAADWLGAAPDECLMVAAHNYDLVAAKGCGFRTAFIHRGAAAHGPDDTEDLAPRGAFDLEARDLCDLADQLGC